MIILLSPAKDLNEKALASNKGTEPQFIENAQQLVLTMKKKSVKQLSKLMGISDALAQLNYTRYQSWDTSSTTSGIPALDLYHGTVYKCLDAASLDKAGRTYAQQHLRILSGMYGMLRPNDLIQPHRLEMGTKLTVGRRKGLYAFWENTQTVALNELVRTEKSGAIINLASAEYMKVLKLKEIPVPVITPVFRDLSKDGSYKTKFFYAKQHRGFMARYLIEHRAMAPAVIKKYTTGGYRYSAGDSTDTSYVFLRDTVKS